MTLQFTEEGRRTLLHLPENVPWEISVNMHSSGEKVTSYLTLKYEDSVRCIDEGTELMEYVIANAKMVGSLDNSDLMDWLDEFISKVFYQLLNTPDKPVDLSFIEWEMIEEASEHFVDTLAQSMYQDQSETKQP